MTYIWRSEETVYLMAFRGAPAAAELHWSVTRRFRFRLPLRRAVAFLQVHHEVHHGTQHPIQVRDFVPGCVFTMLGGGEEDADNYLLQPTPYAHVGCANDGAAGEVLCSSPNAVESEAKHRFSNGCLAAEASRHLGYYH